MPETPNGATETAPAAHAVQAPSAIEAPPTTAHADLGSDQSDDDEPVQNLGELRRLRRRYEREREARQKAEAQASEYQQREAKAKQDEHWAEFEALKQFKADAEKAQAEAARKQIRQRNADAILSDVKPELRDDVELMLAGMQLTGDIDLYNEAEGAGIKLREKLGNDRPDWFGPAPDGATEGMPGIPGQGLPQGPSINWPKETLSQVSDEALKQYIAQNRSSGAAVP